MQIDGGDEPVRRLWRNRSKATWSNSHRKLKDDKKMKHPRREPGSGVSSSRLIISRAMRGRIPKIPNSPQYEIKMRIRQLRPANWYFRPNQHPPRLCNKLYRQPAHYMANVHQTGTTVAPLTTALTIHLRTRPSQLHQNALAERETLKTSSPYLNGLWGPSKISLQNNPRGHTFLLLSEKYHPRPSRAPINRSADPHLGGRREVDVSFWCWESRDG